MKHLCAGGRACSSGSFNCSAINFLHAQESDRHENCTLQCHQRLLRKPRVLCLQDFVPQKRAREDVKRQTKPASHAQMSSAVASLPIPNDSTFRTATRVATPHRCFCLSACDSKVYLSYSEGPTQLPTLLLWTENLPAQDDLAGRHLFVQLVHVFGKLHIDSHLQKGTAVSVCRSADTRPEGNAGRSPAGTAPSRAPSPHLAVPRGRTSSSDSLCGTEKQLVTSTECLSTVPAGTTAVSGAAWGRRVPRPRHRGSYPAASR